MAKQPSRVITRRSLTQGKEGADILFYILPPLLVAVLFAICMMGKGGDDALQVEEDPVKVSI